ncbi:GyrI-like small molecule binding domain-containing protein [Clostridium collagenovorans DSM 3089]|uniref:GyrI-like small molecule binding domain-containing protein n=2 Tax=Clostridium TaxID=1485 RepID=A0A1M5S262_9CLOT|nr:GyrI-like small molecule binding domain-containing protein [Clostridium collagenovorans DSM 3089]
MVFNWGEEKNYLRITNMGANISEAYTRVITEWLPQSGYNRNKAVPNLEVYPPGNASSNNYTWEIWLPVL